MTIERPPLRIAPPPELGSAAGPLGVPVAVLGLVLFLAAVAALPRLSFWGGEYGGILIYLAFMLYTAVAGALIRWGIDTAADRRARLGRVRSAARESRR
ncbi:hypothetical protein [Nocardia sp. NPDC051570]|uniref:hypothetical protein n=1 Tax=Nocardia sp. NPDC051570 TaxID=3364324 RepID=UPI0037A74DAD